jgi:hypothetical protein
VVLFVRLGDIDGETNHVRITVAFNVIPPEEDMDGEELDLDADESPKASFIDVSVNVTKKVAILRIGLGVYLITDRPFRRLFRINQARISVR